MIIPIGTDASDRVEYRTPWITFGIMVVCLLVFGWQSQVNEQIATAIKALDRTDPLVFLAQANHIMQGSPQITYGFLGPFGWPSIITHMFLHLNIIHLVSSMWILYILGSKIEDLWGPVAFLLLFLLGGMVAALGHLTVAPPAGVSSRFIQVIFGSSGALACLMGAFMVRFSQVRMQFALFIWLRPILFAAPAYIVLLVWFAFEVGMYVFNRSNGLETVGHICAFVFGAGVSWALWRSGIESRLHSKQARKEIDAQHLHDISVWIDQEQFTRARTPLLAYLSRYPKDPQGWVAMAKLREATDQDATLEWKKAAVCYRETDPEMAAQMLFEGRTPPDLKLALDLCPALPFQTASRLLMLALQDVQNREHGLYPKALYTVLSMYPTADGIAWVRNQLEHVADPHWRLQLEEQLERFQPAVSGL